MTRPVERSKEPAETSPDNAELRELYSAFADYHLSPLWTQASDLLPVMPQSNAVPHHWKWAELYRLAARSGQLVPVGRGGERRAIALANPGLGGAPYASPTIWAAIQYLEPGENAPEHRHTQNAFRFVVTGEGVWTVVDGDPVAMRRGDFLLTPGWHFHGHQNASTTPMAWIDGLDVPFANYVDVGFFEYGADKVTNDSMPTVSRSERTWAYPGLRPVSRLDRTVSSPIAAYRWEYTDRALAEQLLLEDEGFNVTLERGHAAVRYVNPTTGGDVMPTLRAEFHRLRAGTTTRQRRDVGSAVWQVFEGRGQAKVGGQTFPLEFGDLFVTPSWQPWHVEAETDLDLFYFSDSPVIERLGFNRTFIEQQG